jgi:ABC-2 type transport system ATP-binding protein
VTEATTSDPAVRVDGLTIRYGRVVAVDNLSLEARHGEVLALVGANGAGKTSTIEAVEGYRRPASGTVRVLGLDPTKQMPELAPRLGVMLQQGGVYPSMTAAEVLDLFAAYYPTPADPAGIAERLGLSRVADTPWKRLSGGEQRLVALGLALVGRPSVALLDEPTAGVDPTARQEVRAVVRELADAGACVVLSSHDLEEVEAVADRVLIVDKGRAVAEGSPGRLTEGPEEIRFVAAPGLDKAALATAMGGTVSESTPGRYRLSGLASPDRVAQLTAWLAGEGVLLLELRTGSESLPEAFRRLTGSRQQDE